MHFISLFWIVIFHVIFGNFTKPKFIENRIRIHTIFNKNFSATDNFIPFINSNSDTLISRLFEKRKGNLRFPVIVGTVVEKFGEKIHPKFKRVTVRNDGISIKVVSGTVINSVFIGKVSSIILIPGSNYSIILKHGSYYTVYTNLYKIFVSVGDVVKEGQDLGIIMSNNSKIKSVVFSFQIWHNKEKMDPNDWLINSFETQ